MPKIATIKPRATKTLIGRKSDKKNVIKNNIINIFIVLNKRA